MNIVCMFILFVHLWLSVGMPWLHCTALHCCYKDTSQKDYYGELGRAVQLQLLIVSLQYPPTHSLEQSNNASQVTVKWVGGVTHRYLKSGHYRRCYAGR